jgi:uncharacterized iron-regulated membrane protein
MVDAWDGTHGAAGAGKAKLDWRKKMSDNVAYALLVYTALQIFVTMGQLHGEGGSILPYLALIILVVGIIPACRSFERRWVNIAEADATNPELAPAFRRDRMMLWLLAIGLPFVLTGLFKLLAIAFG